MSAGKAKLRPSQDVLQRLRWDERFDAGAYVVVYSERGGGTRELAVPRFLESQRIPWSRVIAVKHQSGDLLWDRAARLDRLFGSGLTPESDLITPSAEAGARGNQFGVALPPWRFVGANAGAEWSATAEPEPGPASGPLRVLSWNLLFDRFSPERVASARRLPVQLEVLRQADADLIALQEVTPEFWRALLAEPWVRASYWASEGPAGATLDPSGQALLSRLPLEAVRVHAYSARKQVVVGVVRSAECRLVTAVVHLTSNRTERAPEIRREQLRTLVKQLSRAHPDDDWLIAGDFNQGEGEEDGGLARAGARDLWPALGAGPGFSYDPSSNALAAFFSGSGSPARFDRIYLRSRADRWRGASVSLEAREPIPGCDPPLWPSDHFALNADLTPSDGLGGEPVRTTALALIPPARLWGALQRLRRVHDDRLERWPPHLNLVYGFVPLERFPAAQRRLGPIARAAARPQLQLEQVEAFTQRREDVLWASPSPRAPLEALQSALAAELPGCASGARGFRPHLTLGRLPRAQATPEVRAAWAAELGPLSWEPDAVYLLAREDRTPFRVVAALPFGPPRSLHESLEDTGLLLDASARAERAAVAEGLGEVCREAGAAQVELLGSGALGVALRASDLDLWAALPPGSSSEDFLTRVEARIRAGRAGSPWLASELAPAGETLVLRASLRGASGPLRIDVQSDRRPPLGVAEIAATRAAAASAPEAFQLGLLALRAWARLREADKQAFGFLGGVAWAALAVHTWRELVSGEADSPGPTGEALFAAALERLARGGPSLGASVTPRQVQTALPWLPAASDPGQELASGLRPSAWRALEAEARQAAPLAAAALSGQGAWSGLLLPLQPPAKPRAQLALEIAPQAAASAEGWVASLAQELLRRLEQAGASPRAIPTPLREDADSGRLELTWTVALRAAPRPAAWEQIVTWLERSHRFAPHGSRLRATLES